MASHASGFELDISFMSDEDKAKAARYVADVDHYWCRPEWIYQPESEGYFSKDYLYTEESGINWEDIQTMMDRYIEFVLKKYPNINTSGYVHYDQLNAEGEYRWHFTIENGEATITEYSAPLNTPHWCPECEEEFDYYDITDLTPDNYTDFAVKCPKCGHETNLAEEYEIEVCEFTYTAEDFDTDLEEFNFDIPWVDGTPHR